jgi:hypothetical protein
MVRPANVLPLVTWLGSIAHEQDAFVYPRTIVRVDGAKLRSPAKSP